LSFSFISLKTSYGFPIAITLAGISRVITLPEPITAFSPIFIPVLITTLPPIHTLFPIFIGKAYSYS